MVFQACYKGHNVLNELESSIIRSLKGSWRIIYRALFFLVMITVTIIFQTWSWLIVVVILAACPPTPHLMICVQRMIASAVRMHAAYPSLSTFYIKDMKQCIEEKNNSQKHKKTQITGSCKWCVGKMFWTAVLGIGGCVGHYLQECTGCVPCLAHMQLW